MEIIAVNTNKYNEHCMFWLPATESTRQLFWVKISYEIVETPKFLVIKQHITNK